MSSGVRGADNQGQRSCISSLCELSELCYGTKPQFAVKWDQSGMCVLPLENQSPFALKISRQCGFMTPTPGFGDTEAFDGFCLKTTHSEQILLFMNPCDVGIWGSIALNHGTRWPVRTMLPAPVRARKDTSAVRSDVTSATLCRLPFFVGLCRTGDGSSLARIQV